MKLFYLFFTLLLFFIGALGCENFETRSTLSNKEVQNLNIKAFTEVKIQGDTSYSWKEKYHPFVGATPIDIDNDGSMEIFVGGQHGYKDWLFSYTKDNTLVDIIDQTSLSSKEATHGANSIDIDHDGDTDLILSRSDGIFLYINNNGKFTKKQIPVNLPKNSAPLNVAIGDIDKDGDGDLYISNFVDFKNFKSATYNDAEHAKKNNLLLNNGDLTFTDITASSGTASLNNTFVSSFIDLDSDGFLDLVVAQNTGQVELFRNNGDLTFTASELPTKWGFWMGLAAGDIDNDGDDDLFFTNSGTSIPHWILNAASDATPDQPLNTKWALFRNDGNFQFTDITKQQKLDRYGFGWGAALIDITLGGQLSLLVGKNYIKWPFHASSLFRTDSNSLVQYGSPPAFYHVEQLGLEENGFTQSPLIVDFNQDGKPDIFWINMGGEVGHAFINQSENNYLTFQVPDDASYIGTIAQVTTKKGKVYTRRIYNNTGFSMDHISAMTFGLGKDEEVQEVIIKWPNGSETLLEDNFHLKIIKISSSTAFIQKTESEDTFE